MLWTPQKGRIRVEHNTGTVGASNPGTSVTTGAASGTKGTAVQLIASTTFDAYWIMIAAHNYAASATDSQAMMDILTGAATEEVLIPNLMFGYCGSMSSAVTAGPKSWSFPLYIPAGTRLAAQGAGMRTSTAFRVAIYLYGGDGMAHLRVGSKVTTYGMTSVPFGTTLTPGASAAEGAWAQMTASTTEDHFAVLPDFQTGTDTTMSNLTFAVDVGVGAATEEEIAQSYWWGSNTNETMFGPIPSMPTFQDIPSGSRLSMRASCNGVLDAGNYNGVLHCVS